MLILTRRTGQSIFLGDDIKITVTDASGDKVRIGIDAPASCKIMREELRLTEESNKTAVIAQPQAKDLLKKLAGK